MGGATVTCGGAIGCGAAETAGTEATPAVEVPGGIQGADTLEGGATCMFGRMVGAGAGGIASDGSYNEGSVSLSSGWLFKTH